MACNADGEPGAGVEAHGRLPVVVLGAGMAAAGTDVLTEQISHHTTWTRSSAARAA